MISDKEVRCLKYFESGEYFEKYFENKYYCRLMCMLMFNSNFY